MSYVIEKNVPVPPHGNAGALNKTLRAMEVGDSLVVTDKTQQTVWTTASKVGKQMGWAFVTRAAEGGIRVWRIE